jgi:hypothetical protein
MLPGQILADPISLMSDDPQIIEAWHQTADGHHETLFVSKDLAGKLYDAGMTLFAPIHAPVVKTAAETLAVKLGRSPRDVRVSVFMAKANCGSVMHFDSSDTITIQLSGTKTWTVAKATEVEIPVVNASPFWREEDAPGRSSLGWYQATPWPKEMPANAAKYQMTPGSFLYVPAGWWHATVASADSLSLNVLFRHTPERSWAGIMGKAVERILLQDPRWRRYATGAWPGSLTSPAARSNAKELLRALKLQLERLLPDDLLSAEGDLEPPQITEATLFDRHAMAYLFASNQQDGEGVRIVLGNHSNGTEFSALLSQNDLRLLDWIQARKEGFCARDIFAARHSLTKKRVLALLTMLLQAAVLRPAVRH